MQTRLFRIIRQIIYNTQAKFRGFKAALTFSILLFFIGFLNAIFFWTILPLMINTQKAWVLILLIMFFEKLGQYIYTTKTNPLAIKLLNSWRIGFLLGFFIEAFKVTS